MNFLKSKHAANKYNPSLSTMSTKTKDFIQKICYKKTASVDMMKHGFLCDNKLYAVNLLLRPLREKLEKICGKQTEGMIIKGKQKKSALSKKKKTSGSKVARMRQNADRANKLKKENKRRKKLCSDKKKKPSTSKQ